MKSHSRLPLLLVFAVLGFHACFAGLCWLTANLQYIRPNLPESTALVLCSLGLVWGVAIIRRASR